RPSENLGLYGFGASAHIVIQLARHQRNNVFVFTRGESHQAHARELGAAWTGRAEDTPPEQLHAAIIFAPAGSLVREALRVVRKSGTLALAGITMSQIPALDYELLYHEKIIRSVANATRQDAPRISSTSSRGANPNRSSTLRSCRCKPSSTCI